MAATNTKLDFDAVLAETHARIRAYIAGMGIARHEVDDVAQEVYLEFYKSLEKMPEDLAPERWLKGIARNLCLNHIRRCARRGRLHHQALAEILARTESELESPGRVESLHVALDTCLRKLPPKSREILQLRYEQDLPSHSIADALGSTAEAIRIALFRIRNGLRDCIANSLARESA
ncbi:MAG: sigma-70 family RNA polymerase sigma factor [Pirellulaceae bacterium]|nr:sigma-70 family RNA polymerase sigma factor [Planctomycetales bacterium]MCA9208452.1 sigma-70 family RNA polymerase sigma factor [Planctomycetales bacterium]MCA9221930.1 sigma-70 family RNA polymerase sigma factor [Planctomycetales bacterium]